MGRGLVPSEARLEPSLAGPIMGSMRSLGRRLSAEVCMPSGEVSSKQTPYGSAPISGCNFSYSTVGSGTHSMPVPGPRPARAGGMDGIVQCW